MGRRLSTEGLDKSVEEYKKGYADGYRDGFNAGQASATPLRIPPLRYQKGVV